MHFSIPLKFQPCGKERSPVLFSSYDISFYSIFHHRAAALEWQDDTGGLTQSGPLVNWWLKLKAKQRLLVKVRLQWKPFASLLRFRPLENKLKAVLSQTPNIQFKSWTIITLDCKLTGKNISVQRAPLAITEMEVGWGSTVKYLQYQETKGSRK